MNPVALITGGSRGLGKAGALALAERGCDLIITYQHNSDGAQEVVKQIQALGQQAYAFRLDTCDIASFGLFRDALSECLEKELKREHINYLLNNAGFGIHSPFADTKLGQVEKMLDVHVKGPYFLTQTLLPLLADGGRILNVSSGLTRFSLPGYSAYAMAKGAVEAMTRYMAKELAPRGICVNTLAPGAIETDFGGGAVRDNPNLNRVLAESTALGRVGLPEDIAGVIALLLDEQSRWINGQRIEASGGMYL